MLADQTMDLRRTLPHVDLPLKTGDQLRIIMGKIDPLFLGGLKAVVS